MERREIPPGQILNCANCLRWQPSEPYKLEDRVLEPPQQGKKGTCEAAHDPDTTIKHRGKSYKSVHSIVRNLTRTIKPSKVRKGVLVTSSSGVCNVWVPRDKRWAFEPLQLSDLAVQEQK